MHCIFISPPYAVGGGVEGRLYIYTPCCFFYVEFFGCLSLLCFQTCGACTVCGWLFLSQGLISWERINKHFEDDHPDTILQPSAKIKQFDIAKVIKGKIIKRILHYIIKENAYRY